MEPAAATVEKYIHTTASGSAARADLAALLHADAEVTIHPNLTALTGTRSKVSQMQTNFERGKSLIAWQKYEIHGHDLPAPNRVITRATWTGEVAIDLADWPAGTRLRAEIAMFFELRDGKIYRQENFDCYYPAEVPAAAPA